MILTGAEAPFGPADRLPGIIEPVDVALLSLLFTVGGSDGAQPVSRRAADEILSLDAAADPAASAEGWQDVFVRAVAAYVMDPNGAWRLPTPEDGSRREAWMRDRREIGRLLKTAGDETPNGRAGRAWGDVDIFTDRCRRRFGEESAHASGAADSQSAVGETEALWLIGWIGKTRPIRRSERALLQYLSTTAGRVHPLLLPLIRSALG